MQQLKPMKIKPKKHHCAPKGLGGWFTLVIIGQVAMIIMVITTILQDMLPIWVYLDVFLRFWFVFLFINEGVLSGVILGFIFARKMIFRTLFIVQSIGTFIFGIVHMPFLDTDFLPGLIARAFWIVYLFRSERVNNTFSPLTFFNQKEEEPLSPS